MDNQFKNNIKSIGVIFYRFHNNKLQLLLCEKDSIYQDIGGNVTNQENLLKQLKFHIRNITNFKIDINTNSISNNQDFNNYIYNSKSQKIIYFIKANKYIANLNISDFGKYQVVNINTLIKRNIIWIDIDKFNNGDFKKYLISKNLVCDDLYFSNLYDFLNVLSNANIKRSLYDILTIKWIILNTNTILVHVIGRIQFQFYNNLFSDIYMLTDAFIINIDTEYKVKCTAYILNYFL